MNSMLRVTVTRNRIPVVRREIVRVTDRVVAAAAAGIAATAKQSIGAGGVSAPGQPPHAKSGELEASVTVRRVRVGHWKASVGSYHGFVMEFGSRHVAPRPFFVPAARRQIPKFEAELKAALRRL